jgi:transcriptional regulator with XRE-family HTH domain
MDIGKRIKELRLANQLTQEELAARSDLTAAFISMVESNKSSISLEYLIKILTVLGETPSGFFSSDDIKPFVFGKQDRVEIKDMGIDKFELLIPTSTTMAMEPSKLLLSPGQKLGPIKPHSGEEIGFVIRGKVLIGLDKRKKVAKTGCSFHFKADQTHSFENVGDSAAEILLVTWPPQF